MSQFNKRNTTIIGDLIRQLWSCRHCWWRNCRSFYWREGLPVRCTHEQALSVTINIHHVYRLHFSCCHALQRQIVVACYFCWSWWGYCCLSVAVRVMWVAPPADALLVSSTHTHKLLAKANQEPKKLCGALWLGGSRFARYSIMPKKHLASKRNEKNCCTSSRNSCALWSPLPPPPPRTLLLQKELWNSKREMCWSKKQKSDTQIERKMRRQLCDRA